MFLSNPCLESDRRSLAKVGLAGNQKNSCSSSPDLTEINCLLVPVIYAIFVLDLKLVKWDTSEAPGPAIETTAQVAES